MRWIVITLIAINAAYFVWQQQFSASPPNEVTAVATTGKELRLASEVATPTPAAVEVPPPHAAVSDSNPGTQQHLSPPPVTTTATVQPPAPVAKEPNPQPRACYSIGPFLLVNDVNNTAKLFEGVDGMSTQQRAAAERSQAGYWAYVPPLDTLQAARAVLRDLQDRGIREILIISEGARANAISAGVYTTEAQAQERRDAIHAFGYTAEIEPLYRTQPQYWLDVDVMKSQMIPVKLWQKISKKFPNITQAQRPCE